MRRLLIALLALATLAACGPGDRAAAPPLSPEEHAFTGRWTVTGEVRRLPFEEGRRVGNFQMRGTIHFTDGGGLRDLGAEMLGLADSATGCTARSVWSDADGDRLFSEMSGQLLDRGGSGEGAITGGTGKFAGARGAYTFSWTSMVEEDDFRINGFIRDLKGTLLIPSRPAAGVSGEGGTR